MNNKLINELCQLIEIQSVYNEEPVDNGPFGGEVKRALEKVLEIGSNLGFSIKNYNGYVGELTMGNGTYIIGVLCHVDVVAAGTGWETDPFKPLIKDGKLFGRGSSDDKGPLVASLFAIKRIVDEGNLPENVSIRVIIGTNEEESWEDINYYVNVVDRFPDVSIVPDGAFPVIYCEKGLYDLDITYNNKETGAKEIQLIELYGGEGRNIVAPKCICILRVREDLVEKVAKQLETIIAEKNFDGEVTFDNSFIRINIHGRSAHAMAPEKGINGVSQMMVVLEKCCQYEFSHQDYIMGYLKKIGLDYNGKRGGFGFEDADSGKLTFNVGKVQLDKYGNVILTSNIRYPATMAFETVRAAIADSLGEVGFTLTDVDHLPPVLFDRNGALIRTLMKVYQSVTGDKKSMPIAMGGATYARAIPNAVSFGPLFPYEEELAHEANEYISLDSLEKAEEIYYQALLELATRKDK